MLSPKDPNVKQYGKYIKAWKSGQYKHLFFQDKLIRSIDMNDIESRKLAVVDLVELGYLKKGQAAELCDFHRNSVTNLVKKKALFGYKGVLIMDKGPKRGWKINEDILRRVKGLISEDALKDDEIAQTVSNEFDTTISRSSIQRIRTVGQRLKPPQKDIAKAALRFEKEYTQEKQLEFDFALKTDPQLLEKTESFAKEALTITYCPSDERYLELLEKGLRSRYAGSLIYNVPLGEIGFGTLVDDIYPAYSSGYRAGEILLTLFHSLQLGFPSIESLKKAERPEFGLLIGKASSPLNETIHDRLNSLVPFRHSERLIENAAISFIKAGYIDLSCLFTDGHVFPYHGMEPISKAYHTVRRMVIKGNMHYGVNDGRGRPLFFITEPAHRDFREVVLEIIDRLKGLGINFPKIVFDREGYGVDFFKAIAEKRATFITWGKHVAKKSLDATTDWFCSVKVNGICYNLYQEPRTISNDTASIDLRMVVFENLNNSKRVPIFTNNKKMPIYEVAELMLGRWGASEDYYKEMQARYNLNYNPGYDIKELISMPLVKNPKLKELKKKKKALSAKIKALESLLGKRILNNSNEALTVERLKNRQRKLLPQLTSLRKKRDEIDKELEKTPEKVSVVEILKGQKMKACDLEKKKIYDAIQIIAYNTRERLVELFKEVYKDSRDCKQILDMITSRGGIVKRFGKTLVVILDRFHNRKYQKAAEDFCNNINSMSAKTCDRFGFNIYFRVSQV